MRASLVRVFAAPLASPPSGGPPFGTLVLVVPLTGSDQLDDAAFAGFADVVTITWEGPAVPGWPNPERLAPLRPDPRGWLVQPTDMEDAPPWRVVAQAIRPGGYLTLWPPNGDSLGFRIVNVETLG
ncbi:MAG: hypothetical protein BGO51_11600 [Rhodospirillales bacterium 69-11]|nr:hypothetical protein [Rhodospirillales bacterium]OJW29657.1 MAG: hypothetical protein BGO51_11600 [Rhodospirillales bacterium 69-11]